jgi:hypothetical protein
MMPSLEYGADTNAWAYVAATGLVIGLASDGVVRLVNPAYALGGITKLIALGIAGAIAGAAGAETLALASPSPAAVCLCAWVGSLMLLDLNYLVHHGRRRMAGQLYTTPRTAQRSLAELDLGLARRSSNDARTTSGATRA